jgi:RHO protein GDP dissociation inhibitor
MADKNEDAEDFAAINTPGGYPFSYLPHYSDPYVGYKPAAGKSVDEYRNLDAGDESLARWKASLGLDSAAAPSVDTSQPKVLLFTNKPAIFIYCPRSLLS